jgi:hypothetical protein
MIEKTFIQKILRSTLRRSRGLSDHHLMHPTREWFSGLGVALLLLIIGTAGCVYLYWQYNTIEPETAAAIEAPATIYQEDAVKSALLELKERATRLEAERQRLESGRTPPPAAEPEALPETEVEISTTTVVDTLPEVVEPSTTETTTTETGTIEMI